MLEQVRELYEDYTAEFARLESNRRLGAGMFGLGGGPRDYPCHERFSRALEELLCRAASNEAQAEEILEYVYFAPLGRRKDAVYWMMTAVHGMTLELVGQTSPRGAGQLLARYQEAYPRREWLPVQKKVAAALKTRANG